MPIALVARFDAAEIVPEALEKCFVVDAGSGDRLDGCERFFASQIDVPTEQEKVGYIAGYPLVGPLHALFVELGRQPRDLIVRDGNPVDLRHADSLDPDLRRRNELIG